MDPEPIFWELNTENPLLNFYMGVWVGGRMRHTFLELNTHVFGCRLRNFKKWWRISKSNSQGIELKFYIPGFIINLIIFHFRKWKKSLHKKVMRHNLCPFLIPEFDLSIGGQKRTIYVRDFPIPVNSLPLSLSLSKRWFMVRGIIPDLGSFSQVYWSPTVRSPSIVKVLPVPVCPYAKMVQL